MDAKEIKTALKGVKESLDAKDYKSAIKQCKNILKADRNNYLALVFFGAALQESEQKDEAPKAFKKAIEVSPEQLLAWRGLASFYEKDEKYQKELLNVYLKLIILESDSGKYSELIKKYEKLALSMSNTINYNEMYDIVNEISDESKKLMMEQCLVAILSNVPSISDEVATKYLSLLSHLLSIKPVISNHLELSKKYLKALYKDQKLKELLTEASLLQAIYPKETFILEWICKAYTELPQENDLNHFSPKEAYSSLLESIPDSYLGILCKGIHELHTMDLQNAYETLKEAVNLKPTAGLPWFLLCQSQILLYQFSEAEISARKALMFFENNNKKNKANILKLELWLIQSLSEEDSEDKLLEAVKLGKIFLEKYSDNFEVLPFLIKALIGVKNYEEVDKYLKILQQNEKFLKIAKYLKCLSFKSQGNLTECQRELEDLVKENPDFFEGWLELGKLYYESKNNACLQCLLKSAKLNQWCFWNFLYLGHCYRYMIQDLDKARRCYQKAFQLNPKNAEAGMCLSDIYRNLKKEDLNLQLLSVATSQSCGSKWAWLRLGLHYLSINKQQEAVNSLRAAVRLDPNDKNLWESLGDAYLSSGAYTSAIKSYQRVIELDQESFYPHLQIATVKHLCGDYEESVSEFRIVLERNQDYLPSLKGHAEACLSLVKHFLSQNLNGRAGDLCQEAVNSLVRCLLKRKDLICIWKLLGDACLLLSSLRDKYCHLKIAAWLSCDSTQSNGNSVNLNREDILKLAARSYCQAITLSPKTSSYWYDLSSAYNSLAKINQTSENRKQIRELALSAVKKSIQLDSKNWESWNLLGTICASDEIKNYQLAQHAFIQAITNNDTSAQAWTNLGTLYLCLGDLQLANQSFGEAQRCDHDYVQCWVGQALIAEKLAHHDAMDLFRHSTQLGFHEEGSLGYANSVCKTLLGTKNKTDRNYIYSIKNMNAISVACDAMTWYTDRKIDNPCAWNMLGLLQERQMLYNLSSDSFSKALNLLECKKLESEEAQSDLIDMVLLNKGRIMVNLKKYEEALTYLKRIKKATFVNQCGLAAAYFKAGLYEEAYASYETTLEWLAPDCGFKSHILVAMATVVYMHQGQEDAKILLMQAAQLKPPSVEGLFALCALGMLHSNLSLSELSLKELAQHEDDPRYLSHIAIFRAYIYLFKGKKDDAIRAFCKAIHRHPNQPSLWLSLCLLLLHLYPNSDSRIAARCAEVTMRTGKSAIDVSKVMSLVSLSNLLSGEGLMSLRSAQKAVHMFPYVTENWIVLIASVLSKCLAQENITEVLWLKKIITYVRRKLEASKAMTQWLSNNDRKVSLMADKLGYGCPVIEVEPSYFNIENI